MTLTKMLVISQRDAATHAHLGSLGSSKQIGLVLFCTASPKVAKASWSGLFPAVSRAISSIKFTNEKAP
jgi:hypothetical protein